MEALEDESVHRRYGLGEKSILEGDRSVRLEKEARRARTAEAEAVVKLENANKLLTRVQEMNQRLEGRIKDLTPAAEYWQMIADFWKMKHKEERERLVRLSRSVRDAVEIAIRENMGGPEIRGGPEGNPGPSGQLSMSDLLGEIIKERSRRVDTSEIRIGSFQR